MTFGCDWGTGEAEGVGVGVGAGGAFGLIPSVIVTKTVKDCSSVKFVVLFVNSVLITTGYFPFTLPLASCKSKQTR
ncbi:hypothetical protein SDC9_191834 [bioreactor metagenome]|uniref:Uncharacterized protein n=1 Tax=bioreactor metagenome TaxID=1076179 RepID=A0A645I0K0_9ZZZZ